MTSFDALGSSSQKAPHSCFPALRISRLASRRRWDTLVSFMVVTQGKEQQEIDGQVRVDTNRCYNSGNGQVCSPPRSGLTLALYSFLDHVSIVAALIAKVRLFILEPAEAFWRLRLGGIVVISQRAAAKIFDLSSFVWITLKHNATFNQ